jgi:hypothetical protein
VRAVCLEGTNVWTAAGTGACDDFGLAIAVQIRRRNEHTASERAVIGAESVRVCGIRCAVCLEGTNVWAAAASGTRDDFCLAIAVQIGGSYEDAAGRVGVRVEIRDESGAVSSEHAYTGGTAGAGTGDDFRLPVTIQIAYCDTNPAGPIALIRGEVCRERHSSMVGDNYVGSQDS